MSDTRSVASHPTHTDSIPGRLGLVVAWTGLHGLAYLGLRYAGAAVVSGFHRATRGIAEGILVAVYFWVFVALSGAANCVLEFRPMGGPRRIFVWGVLLLTLILLYLSALSSNPLLIPFLHCCGIGAIALGEGTRFLIRRR